MIQALPQDASLQQDLAAATMQGMVGSLDDDHTRWGRPIPPPAEVRRRFPHGVLYGLGIVTSASGGGVPTLPEAQPPLFIVSVWPSSPAAQQGLRPGDIIATVNGIPPFLQWPDQSRRDGLALPTASPERRGPCDAPATGDGTDLDC